MTRSPTWPATAQVVAHRGASEDVPEHTLAAYRKAIEDGADALECDVRLTRDGHLVCVHDRRVDRTSNGRGPVSTYELADLARLDWGSWHNRRTGPGRVPTTRDDLAAVPDLDAERATILTLERLCEVVADAARPIELAIEAKHPTRYGGHVERRLAQLLHRFGWAHPADGRPPPVRFMSFSNLAVRRMRLLTPDVPTVLLLERVPPWLREGSLPSGVAILGPQIGSVRADPAYVERVHARGGSVHVWTVDDDDDVRLCRSLGVEAIITNRPGRVLELLGR